MTFWNRGACRNPATAEFGRSGLLAAFCAVLLASCSTASDPVTQFGLAPSSSVDASTALLSGDVDQSLAAAAYVAAQKDGSAPVPAARPDQEKLAQAADEAPADTVAVETASAEQTPAKPTEASPAADVTKPAAAETSSAAADDAPAVETAAATEESAPSEEMVTAEETSAKKRDFLSAFFSPRQANAATAAEKITQPAAARQPAKAEKPKVVLAAASTQTTPVRASLGMGDALPGVRQGENLFEFSRKTGSGDADVDMYEDEPSYQVASAAGMARLAPNGLLKQRDSVDTACLKPALVGVLKSIERHYGRPIVVTSGYRSPSYNQRVRGARNSLHMYCAAADVQIEGVSKWELAKYVRSMPGRGGVGTYCHTKSVHVDVGPERDWNWRCRRRK